MELSDIVKDLKKLFIKSQEVSNHERIDTAIIAIYCDLTGTSPEVIKPYFSALREVSNCKGVDTAILACYAQYKLNHKKQIR